jgi:hypothetical protein
MKAPGTQLLRVAAKGGARRATVWAVSCSLVLHLWLTPLAGWLGVLSSLLRAPVPEDNAPIEQLRSIPITWLGEEDFPPEAPQSALTAPVALTEAPQGPPPDATPLPAVMPAGAPQPRAERPPPVAIESAPKTLRGQADRELAHPIALSGVSTDLLDDNANVNLLLISERIREHPLGPRIGQLLVNFPQWSSFFATAGLDPVRDLNRILIVGPEFRRSADMVAIIEHRLGPEVARRAVDRLVQRPPQGRWLKAKIPIARAQADRAERLFALPARDVLLVAPVHLERQILAAPPLRFPAPEGKEALALHIRAPAHTLRDLPFALPESLSWLRLDLTPLDGGAAELRVSAEDSDARSAAQHARSLSAAVNVLTNPDLGALGALIGLRSIAFIDKIDLQAHGTRIRGRVEISKHQLDRLLTYTEELVGEWSREREPTAPRHAPH